MSRIRYLVSYDICEPKRLRKVSRAMEGFGVRLQYSVFECPLDDMKMAMLKAALQALLGFPFRPARIRFCCYSHQRHFTPPFPRPRLEVPKWIVDP